MPPTITDVRRSVHQLEGAAWSGDEPGLRALREPCRRARQILDRGDTENRDLRPDEIEEIANHVARGRAAVEAAGGTLGRHGYTPDDDEHEIRRRDGYTPDDDEHEIRRRDGSLRQRATLLRGERLYDWLRDNNVTDGWSDADVEAFSIGRMVQGMATGNWHDAELERRALAEGSDSTGGAAVPTLLAGTVIDRVRNATHVLNAGAQLVPVGSDDYSIPRLAADAAGAWRNENAAVAVSGQTFEKVTFTVRSHAVIVLASEELMEDLTPAGAAIIEQSLASSVGVEIDRVALRGSGTAPEPRGVRNQSGVSIISMGTNGATPTSWGPMIDAVADVRGRNIQPTAAIMAPRTRKTFAKLADTTGQPLARPSYLDGVQEFETGQIPINLTQGTSSDASDLYVGRWSDLLIGVRATGGLGIKIVRLNERYADNMQIGIRVSVRLDVQLSHPESFSITTGIRP
jgi:HK97 family phage major capsid protein